MAEILKTLMAGFEDLFPDLGDLVITAETRLGDIPDFDSMAAVNLQSFVEAKFKVTLSLDLLGDDTTIAEIIDFIGHPARKNAAAQSG